ncbi:MAG: aminotransferase class V-fold PLP-dependent enzyme [Thermoanaerobaculia bacterium]|nr:aminotransferase class V-fold PLP-dependent enzyme [Thermoanaerobaculia bacterium]
MDFLAEFPSRKSSIQFNHAAVCPLPARAVAALGAYASNLSTRGALDWRDWPAKADEVRGLAARLIGADERVGGASSISIVPNTTWGLDIVAQGLDLSPGDSIVTTASEFPANLTPWVALENKGVSVRRVPTRDGAFTAEEIIAVCDRSTRLVSASFVAFHTGFRAPVEALGALCRPRGILLGLDGIQGVGAQRVDVADWNVDFLSADGHKWMLGPEGCGLLFTTPELRGRLTPPPGWTNLERAHGADYRVPPNPVYRSDGVRFEPGALPTPALYALAASLELLLEIGLPEIEARIERTLGVLVEGLPRLGFEPVLFSGPPRSGILAARPPAGKDARYFQKRLADENIVVSAREGFLRFSPHVGNDEAEAERVLGLLKRL